MAGLGIAQRMDWIELPGNLEVLSHPLIIGVAIFLYAVEFVADKIPYVDSVWDSVHTFIRPIASAVLGYAAMADAGSVMQVLIAILTGSIAMDSHLTKATTRLAINSSPGFSRKNKGYYQKGARNHCLRESHHCTNWNRTC